MLSIILRPLVSASRLGSMSLLAGLAVARVAEATTGRQATVKWPNDVLIDGRKVAGILLQTRPAGGQSSGYLNLGIGINVGSTPATCTADATSFSETAGASVTVLGVLHRLIAELDSVYRAFLAGDLADAWAEVNDRLAFRDQEVTIEDGDRTIRGIVAGIGDGGELLLRRPDGTIRAVVSGELVRGPRPTLT